MSGKSAEESKSIGKVDTADDEVERLILIYRNHNWKHHALLVLCASIKLLTELHDVDTLRTKSWSDRRSRSSGSAFYLQLYVAAYFLCQSLIKLLLFYLRITKLNRCISSEDFHHYLQFLLLFVNHLS